MRFSLSATFVILHLFSVSTQAYWYFDEILHLTLCEFYLKASPEVVARQPLGMLEVLMWSSPVSPLQLRIGDMAFLVYYFGCSL